MITRSSRREFLKRSSLLFTGIGTASLLNKATGTLYAADNATVAVVKNESAIDDNNKCNSEEAANMITKGLTAITGQNDVGDAWRALGLTKQDVVAIKVNCNRAGFLLNAHPELVYALCESMSAIIPENNIIIYDRDTTELTQVGFVGNTSSSGVRCFGSENAGGFDNEDELTDIVFNQCTKLINLPSLKTFEREYAGTLCLKNQIGTLRRDHMSRCHGNTPFITEVNARPSIRDKTMLILCDGLRGTYQRSTPWYYKGIIMSTDPIATEVTCLGIINEKRKAESIEEMPIPNYVTLADTKYGLGISDTSNITTLLQTMS
ncbi:DUF362 domain-containing protein [Candidatus Latescibacterota bacterium]